MKKLIGLFLIVGGFVGIAQASFTQSAIMAVNAASYSSINAAVAAIGSTETVLVVSSTKTLTGSLTVPNNITLKIVRGGYINFNSSTYTLAVNGYFEAGVHQVFTNFSTGSVSNLQRVDKIYPHWWGARMNGTTDDRNAIQFAMDTASQIGGVVYFPSGVYCVKESLIARSSVTLQGADPTSSILSLPQSNLNPFNFSMIQSTTPIFDFHVNRMGLRGSRPFQSTSVTTQYGGWALKFSTGPMSNISVTRCSITGFGDLNVSNGGGGIWMGAEYQGSTNSVMTNIHVEDNYFGQSGGSEIYFAPGYAQITNANGLFINRNHFETGASSTIYHQNIIYVLAGTYYSASNSAAYNIHVEGNSAQLVGFIDGFIEFDGVTNGTIANNTFRATRQGNGHCLYIAGGATNPFYNQGNVTITGNNFYNDSDVDRNCVFMGDFSNGNDRLNTIFADNVIQNFGITDQTAVIMKDNAYNTDFHDNIIMASTGNTVFKAITLEAIGNTKIHDNIIANSSFPIIMNGGFQGINNLEIYDNNFSTCGSNADYLIKTTGGTNDIRNLVIRNNRVLTPVPGTVAFVTLALSSTTGNILRNNDVQNIPVTDTKGVFNVIENNFDSSISRLNTTTNTWTGPQTFQNELAISSNSGAGAVFYVGKTSVTITEPAYIQGTGTNDSSRAGDYGEYNSSAIAAPGFALINNHFLDVTTITLNGGDYDVWGWVTFDGGAITGTEFTGGVGLVGGDTSSGMVFGDTILEVPNAPTAAASISISAIHRRVTVAAGSQQNVYLKAYGLFTIGTLKAYGKLEWRRAR